jgi:tryptophanyl-tRNA synthetase
VKGNVVFIYLDAFDPDKTAVKALKKDYERGGLGDVVIKKRLTEVLEDLIGPIRTRRQELAKKPEKVMEILREGTEKTRTAALETIRAVRKAIKIDYF